MSQWNELKPLVRLIFVREFPFFSIYGKTQAQILTFFFFLLKYRISQNISQCIFLSNFNMYFNFLLTVIVPSLGNSRVTPWTRMTRNINMQFISARFSSFRIDFGYFLKPSLQLFQKASCYTNRLYILRRLSHYMYSFPCNVPYAVY